MHAELAHGAEEVILIGIAVFALGPLEKGIVRPFERRPQAGLQRRLPMPAKAPD
jgi:hypothetical protein